MLPRLGWLQRHAICAVSQDNTPTPTPTTMGPRLGLMLYCRHLEIINYKQWAAHAEFHFVLHPANPTASPVPRFLS